LIAANALVFYCNEIVSRIRLYDRSRSHYQPN